MPANRIPAEALIHTERPGSRLLVAFIGLCGMSAVAALVEENLTRHSLFQSLPMGSTQSQSQALQETHDHGSSWRKGTCRGSVG